MKLEPCVFSCARQLPWRKRAPDDASDVHETETTSLDDADDWAAMSTQEAVASLPALGPCRAPPAERGPSLESFTVFPLHLIFAKVIR